MLPAGSLHGWSFDATANIGAPKLGNVRTYDDLREKIFFKSTFCNRSKKHRLFAKLRAVPPLPFFGSGRL